MSGCSAASLSTFVLSEVSSACTSARTFQRDAIVSHRIDVGLCAHDQDDVDTFLRQRMDYGKTAAIACRISRVGSGTVWANWCRTTPRSMPGSRTVALYTRCWRSSTA
jgi:hypothetical protein